MGVFSLKIDVPCPNISFFAGLKFNAPVSMHTQIRLNLQKNTFYVWQRLRTPWLKSNDSVSPKSLQASVSEDMSKVTDVNKAPWQHQGVDNTKEMDATEMDSPLLGWWLLSLITESRHMFACKSLTGYDWSFSFRSFFPVCFDQTGAATNFSFCVCLSSVVTTEVAIQNQTCTSAPLQLYLIL